MSVSGVLSAASNIDSGKALDLGMSIGGASAGVYVAASIALPVAVLALISGINGSGRGGAFIPGLVPTVALASTAFVVAGGVVGACLPSVGLKVLEFALGALAKAE
jgi:hypothetical protein